MCVSTKLYILFLIYISTKVNIENKTNILRLKKEIYNSYLTFT